MRDTDIDYDSLIDRSIKEFEPAAKFWPLSFRLVLWISVECGVLMLCASISDARSLISPASLITIGAFSLVSAVAGYFALRSATPGREPARAEELLVIAGLCGAFAFSYIWPSAIPSQIPVANLHWVAQLFGLSIVPLLVLFWTVTRGLPLQPIDTGWLIGLASFSFGIVASRLIPQSTGFTPPLLWQVASGIILTTSSALAGAYWLDPARRWQFIDGQTETQTKSDAWFRHISPTPLFVAGGVIALLLVLGSARKNSTPIPDFDLAIQRYKQAIADFHPNVPSQDIAAMLTAYVEKGMPSYMWDFSRQGFKFAGGRFEHLSDGTPATFTWFPGNENGVMCMLRRADGFRPPSAIHEERQRMLFYQYRGFSVCLINVGGYGNFLSVIVAPMPIDRFIPLVMAATA
jgi:Negative regulator of sigma F